MEDGMSGPDSPEVAPAEPAAAWEAPAAPAATPVPGAAGFVYADVPNRIIALIIDGIVLGIITMIVNTVVYGIVGQPVTFTGMDTGIGFNMVALLVGAVVSLVLSAVYFVYSWTRMRATPGQKVLGMQVGNAPDGKTLTQEQALRRWAILFGPFAIGQVVYVAPTIGMLLGLASIGYAIYLLYTTSQSPTKQGFHDQFAGTVVVKAARSV
jgi:uncharacterized RDD family membrane protein YckC